MERKKVCVVETAYGYVGFSWTPKGINGVTLPCANPPEALVQLERYTRGKSLGAELLPPEPGEPAHGLGEALRDYFDGGNPHLAGFPIDYSAHSSFRTRVLQVVRNIPYGTVLSYGQVAALAGNPKACRAVGSAMSCNGTLYLVPCHRVIKSDGFLGGFGSGIEWKCMLLKMEGIAVDSRGKIVNPHACCPPDQNMIKYDSVR